MNGQYETLGLLSLKGTAIDTPAGRKAVVEWLLKQAAELERPGTIYAGNLVFKYRVRQKVPA